MTRLEAIEHLKNIAIYSVQDGYTDEARQALDMAIKALEEPHWIPCSERLPEAEYGESDNVLTTCIYKDAVDGYRSVKTLYYNGGVWCYPTGETFEGKVLAWMSLPEPYGGESDE